MKILMVSTISDTINTFLIPHIKMLVEEGVTVDVAFNIEQEVNSEITNLNCKVYDIPFSRSLLKNDYPKIIKELQEIIKKEKYDIVHTHTPIASAIVRFACKDIRSTKVYYTAHGFHFYRGSSITKWLSYYPIEKFLSRYTDKLITINKEDYKISKTFYAKENVYIPGVGINLEKFNEIDEINIDYLFDELKVSKKDIVLFSIGELNKNKNHEVVLKAISKLNNEDIIYIIAGEGPLKKSLETLALNLKIEKQVHFLGYRTDIKNLLKFSDIFIFPSFREGLSVSVMEAMAMGKPVIASRIRGNTDLIEENRGGLLFNPSNSSDLTKKLNVLINQENMRKSFGKHNLEKIKLFSLEYVLLKIKKIYQL